ncbi:MAG: hypothetical protein AB8B66_01845 [Rickettsiaceae bacterium]
MKNYLGCFRAAPKPSCNINTTVVKVENIPDYHKSLNFPYGNPFNNYILPPKPDFEQNNDVDTAPFDDDVIVISDSNQNASWMNDLACLEYDPNAAMKMLSTYRANSGKGGYKWTDFILPLSTNAIDGALAGEGQLDDRAESKLTDIVGDLWTIDEDVAY